MGFAQQWTEIEQRLPEDWADARLWLMPVEDAQLDRTLALLGPLGPGRYGQAVRFFVGRRGAGPGTQAVLRLMRLLDAEGIRGRLELLEVARLAPTATPAGAAAGRKKLADEWDAALAELPPDWSDLYCELELTSSDHLERAALALAPVNPARYPGNPGFRFRVARRFGYGAAPEMTRRCLARLDEAGIPGHLRMLRVLSDTHPAHTQGPVWYADGKVL